MNSAKKVTQSIGNMSLNDADLTKELIGNSDDPFNLTASSNRGMLAPLAQNGRNNRTGFNSKGMQKKRDFATINHFD